jgi:hypothetical protein
MILSFSKEEFKERIMEGVKIHTIRTDRTERWKKGQKIHFWRGNPRNPNTETKPHQFHESACTSVQKININFKESGINVVVDNNLLTPDQTLELAKSDGFSNQTEMMAWFQERHPNGFKGRLIHWTKKKY